MSESRTKKILTPPIRSIAAEASSLIPSNDIDVMKIKSNSNSSASKSRERSPSSSSYSSTSSDSVASYAVNQDPDDDFSSNDDIDTDLTQLQLRLDTIRRLMPRDSLASGDDIPITIFPTAACQVCCEEFPIRPLSCCSSTICSTCIYSYLSSNITEAKIRISCPSCPRILTREEILLLLSEKDTNGEIAERYKRFFADINREPHIKTCPQCCAIKEVDKNLVEGIRRRKTIPRHVICDECQFNWCFYCHAPWHEKMTCKEYREGEKLLRKWAAETDNNQQNAQQCPRCKVFISRNGGCPHMICTKCHCDFCYNCGKRRYGLKFLGSHESRFSPFGCKYNLYPNQPVLRRTVRGLVAGAATLAVPVAAVGAVALLAVGTTIGAPTYGTYRLVKYIRDKRRNRGLRRRSVPISTVGNNTDDDDLDRAIAASLETYREEIEKQDELSKDYVDDSDEGEM